MQLATFSSYLCDLEVCIGISQMTKLLLRKSLTFLKEQEIFETKTKNWAIIHAKNTTTKFNSFLTYTQTDPVFMF